MASHLYFWNHGAETLRLVCEEDAAPGLRALKGADEGCLKFPFMAHNEQNHGSQTRSRRVCFDSGRFHASPIKPAPSRGLLLLNRLIIGADTPV